MEEEKNKEDSNSPVKETETQKISAFKDIVNMNQSDAINVLIQASKAAHQAGALSIRDSVYLGAAIEIITQKPI